MRKLPALLLVILYVYITLSCSGRSVSAPDETLRQQLDAENSRIRIPDLIDKDLDEEKRVLISVHQKSPEALQLMKFLVPLLYDREMLTISFWFLDGNSESDIKLFLSKDSDAPTAEELLFNTDPRITGYEEYKDFLTGLQDFYGSLDDPETMQVVHEDDAFLRFSLYDPERINEDRSTYILHSPLLPDNRHWEIPFKGYLYYMMIHRWPYEQYSALLFKDSPLKEMYLTKYDQSAGRTAGSYLDGAILMGFNETYTPFTPLPSFINEKNIQQAVEFYPRQFIREKTKPAAYLVNRKVERKHKKLSRTLGREYDKVLELVPWREE
ncbi:MAG: hypothetical protein PQJ58_03790 [Spirochaetales bacterium]|nr:hypothetical protein [Spirochaetales bacterium]